jgi:hypothetical protein
VYCHNRGGDDERRIRVDRAKHLDAQGLPVDESRAPSSRRSDARVVPLGPNSPRARVTIAFQGLLRRPADTVSADRREFAAGHEKRSGCS